MSNIFKNWIKNWLFPLGKVRRVLRGPGKGLRFIVAPGFAGAYAVASRDLHISLLASLIRKQDVVYDIGANRGHVAILFSRLVSSEGTVIAFEPIHELCESIRLQVALNHLMNIKIIETALSNQNGVVDFDFSHEYSTQGKIADVEPSLKVSGAAPLQVRCSTLDCVVLEESVPPPDVLKIDVEGAAGLVLEGASSILSKFRPRIFVELHGPDEQQSVYFAARKYGYNLHAEDGTEILDFSGKWFSPIILVPKVL